MLQFLEFAELFGGDDFRNLVCQILSDSRQFGQIRTLPQHGGDIARQVLDGTRGIAISPDPKWIGALYLQQNRILAEQLCDFGIMNGHGAGSQKIGIGQLDPDLVENR